MKSRCIPLTEQGSQSKIMAKHRVSPNCMRFLEIYSITGTLVYKYEESYSDNGYRIGPIPWDGDDEYGGKLSAGMYIAKLAVSSSDGDFTSKSIRIILLP